MNRDYWLRFARENAEKAQTLIDMPQTGELDRAILQQLVRDLAAFQKRIGNL